MLLHRMRATGNMPNKFSQSMIEGTGAWSSLSDKFMRGGQNLKYLHWIEREQFRSTENFKTIYLLFFILFFFFILLQKI